MTNIMPQPFLELDIYGSAMCVLAMRRDVYKHKNKLLPDAQQLSLLSHTRPHGFNKHTPLPASQAAMYNYSSPHPGHVYRRQRNCATARRIDARTHVKALQRSTMSVTLNTGTPNMTATSIPNQHHCAARGPSLAVSTHPSSPTLPAHRRELRTRAPMTLVAGATPAMGLKPRPASHHITHTSYILPVHHTFNMP